MPDGPDILSNDDSLDSENDEMIDQNVDDKERLTAILKPHLLIGYSFSFFPFITAQCQQW